MAKVKAQKMRNDCINQWQPQAKTNHRPFLPTWNQAAASSAIAPTFPRQRLHQPLSLDLSYDKLNVVHAAIHTGTAGAAAVENVLKTITSDLQKMEQEQGKTLNRGDLTPASSGSSVKSVYKTLAYFTLKG